jgi:hypothetical protein
MPIVQRLFFALVIFSAAALTSCACATDEHGDIQEELDKALPSGCAVQGPVKTHGILVVECEKRERLPAAARVIEKACREGRFDDAVFGQSILRSTGLEQLEVNAFPSGSDPCEFNTYGDDWWDANKP